MLPFDGYVLVTLPSFIVEEDSLFCSSDIVNPALISLLSASSTLKPVTSGTLISFTAVILGIKNTKVVTISINPVYNC